MTDQARALEPLFDGHFGTGLPTSAAPAGFLVRAPGRVNLIGEHTDYNLLPVFPMAIQYGVTVRVRTRDDALVRFANADERFGPVEFRLAPWIAPSSPGHWGNYLKAAAQAVVTNHGATKGIDAMVAGDMPVAAGLSSSSALVVAAGLALLEANGVTVERRQLMDEFAAAEAYVGTRGGGMDQAISLAAQAGMACRIDFAPLRLEPVMVPGDWAFVVASSLVPAQKSGAAQATYNRRTTECREALAQMNEALSGTTPRSYQGLVKDHQATKLVERARVVLSRPLLERFRHVVTEAERVEQAVDAMRDADIDEFGRLMRASHQSLRHDYQVSAQKLDQLVDIAMTAGARGARLTGAGLGGCIVALTTKAKAAVLLSVFQERFYFPAIGRAGSPRELFVAAPSAGASVTTLSR